MAKLVIPNAAQIQIRWQTTARAWLNVFGAIGNPALPVINQALANTLYTAISGSTQTSALLSAFPTTVSLVSLSIRDVSVADRPAFTSTGASRPGTVAGDLLPLSNAICVTLRTGSAGRSFRGRTYLSGYAETVNDPTGRIAAAAASDAAAWVTMIDTTLKANGMALAVLSPPRDARVIPQITIQGKSGFATQFVSAESRNLKWESQRRRTGRT